MRSAFLMFGACAVFFATVVCVCLGADPEVAWRERVRTVVTTNGVAVATDTNTSTTASSNTPAYVGQLLFGGAGPGTNAVWVAKGLTTNDWVRLAP